MKINYGLVQKRCQE